MVNGCCRDEEIEIGNELPGAPQFGPEAAKGFHDRISKRQRLERTQKLSNSSELKFLIRKDECTLEEFAARNYAHRESLVTQFVDCTDGSRFANAGVN